MRAGVAGGPKKLHTKKKINHTREPKRIGGPFCDPIHVAVQISHTLTPPPPPPHTTHPTLRNATPPPLLLHSSFRSDRGTLHYLTASETDQDTTPLHPP